MSATSPAPLARLGANIEALSTVDADLARRVSLVQIPDHVVKENGRDGAPTYRFHQGETRTWFGGSSMPTISGEELHHSLTPSSSNLALPGIFTGIEAPMLARTLPGHLAVVVIEPDLLALRLALELYDYADLLVSRRIVFLTEPDASEGLYRFVEANDGFLPPSTLVTPPQAPRARTTLLQEKLGRAAERICMVQEERMDGCTELIALGWNRRRALGTREPILRENVRCDSPGEIHSIAIVSSDASPATLSFAGLLESEAKRMQITACCSVPDRSDRCHPLVRLRAISSSEADAVIFINCSTSQLESRLPFGFPSASWFHPGSAGVDDSGTGSFAVAFTPTRSATARLVAQGWNDRKVVELGPFVTTRGAHNDALLSSTSGAVAVLAIAPMDEPASVGVTLSSHEALWNAMRQFGTEAIPGTEFGKCSLRAAESSTGVVITDLGLRQEWERLGDEILRPIAATRAALLAVRKSGFPARVWATRRIPDVGDSEYFGAPSIGFDIPPEFLQCGCVVLPVASSSLIQTALQAMARGALVILGGNPKDFAEEYTSLGDLASSFVFVDGIESLTKALGEYLRGDAAGRRKIAEGRRILMHRHTLGHRLRAVLDRLAHESALHALSAGQSGSSMAMEPAK